MTWTSDQKLEFKHMSQSHIEGFFKWVELCLVFKVCSTLKIRYFYLMLANFSNEKGGVGLDPTREPILYPQISQ
jgi:hypothetical protein